MLPAGPAPPGGDREAARNEKENEDVEKAI